MHLDDWVYFSNNNVGLITDRVECLKQTIYYAAPVILLMRLCKTYYLVYHIDVFNSYAYCYNYVLFHQIAAYMCQLFTHLLKQ